MAAPRPDRQASQRQNDGVLLSWSAGSIGHPVGIRITETSGLLQIPYGPPNSEGVLSETGFVDLKAKPDRAGVVPSALGWPDVQALLRTLNAGSSPFMTLASAQGFSGQDEVSPGVVLSSFVTLCYADWGRNSHMALLRLARDLRDRMDGTLQAAATDLLRTVDLRAVLELQPTLFHPERIQGWSLTVWLVAPGRDAEAARTTWRLGVQALAGAVGPLT